MTRGFLLGKFMPPHAGHVFLCQAAANLCHHLTVLVCSLPDDPVPGGLRYDWMRALLPESTVVHYDRVVPQEPEDHPDFWPIWRAICQEAHPHPIDRVFGSEPYIHRLAAELGAMPVLIDPDRLTFPISGSAVRADPAATWDFIPGVVRPFFQKRVVLFGAESVGKSTMTKALAAHFGGPYLPEYGRTYDANRPSGDWTAVDFQTIAAGHRALRAALAPMAGPVLFEDTDPLLTQVWQHFLTGERPSTRAPDLADLYLLLDIDMPWVDDGTRYQVDRQRRAEFHGRCRQILQETGANYRVISGSAEDRWTACLTEISHLTD